MRREKPDFERKLREQVKFISNSSKAFDSGDEEEAIRIATALRIIFHTTTSSTSLVTHLRFDHKRMLSSARGYNNWMDYIGFKENLNSPTPMVTFPLLNDKWQEVNIETWWQKQVVFEHESREYSRKKIILSMANKDGGAHVDSKLEEYYEVLCAGEWGFGITGDLTFDGPEPFPQGVTMYPKNGHLSLIRQFGHEVLNTIEKLKWLA